MAVKKRPAKPKKKSPIPPVAKTEISETYLKKRAFLGAYKSAGSVGAAADAAKIDRNRHYEWLRSDNVYRGIFESVQEDLADSLESEAIRRARDGVKRPVMYKGSQVKVGRRILYHQEYSDQLLITLLKRFRPALYREHVMTEVTGSVELIDRLNAGRQRVLEMRKAENTAG